MNISDWFKGASDPEFGRVQTVGNTLLSIALTMRMPSHPNALMKSCHQYAAACMRYAENNPEPDKQILDTDEILILGINGLVSHTIVVRPPNDDVLIDSLATRGFQGQFSPETGEYFAVLSEGGTQRETTPLTIMKRISFGEFKSSYLDNIVIDRKYTDLRK